MKTLHLVGVGVGPAPTSSASIDTAEGITLAARRILEQAEVFFGAPRMLELVKDLPRPSYPVFKPDDVVRVLSESHPGAGRVAVLLSGDVGFYSGASGLCEAFGGREDWDVRLEPGVSSLSAFCARLRVPWQDVAVVSMHGQDQNVADCVRRNRRTFCLCGNNAVQVAQRLSQTGFGELSVDVGENLGLREERISGVSVDALCHNKTASLTVLLIHNPDPDDRQRTGIPDGEFIRAEKIPMTKSEVRAVALSRLRLSPSSVCYDIGSGTGSVTIEMALAAYRGIVFAIESNPDALVLLYENCRRFRTGNVTPVPGFAPEALASLPLPDAAFIGGSGGKLAEILDLLLERNPQVRLVITAVTIETADEALRLLENRGLPDVEATQVSVARVKKAGRLHMLAAQNPVTVISAGGKQSPTSR